MYKDQEILIRDSPFENIFEAENPMNQNLTTIMYTIQDPDSSWNDVMIQCEQIFTFANETRRSVATKLRVHCKSTNSRFKFIISLFFPT